MKLKHKKNDDLKEKAIETEIIVRVFQENDGFIFISKTDRRLTMGHMATWGTIHSTKLSGNFGPKLNGSVRSNRKSFGKTGPPFEVVLFSRSDQLEFWLNGSRP